jgi:serine/threonine protein kinase
MCSGSASSGMCSVSPEAKSNRAVKLIDFDLAEEYDPTMSQSTVPDIAAETPAPRHVVGTDGYIAPEAYLGAACPKSDVFSAGVAMFILMTGQYPHDRGLFDDGPDENVVGSPKMREINGKLLSSKVRFGRAWDPFPEAKSLCEQMLEYDVHKRPDTLQALEHPFFCGHAKVRAGAQERDQQVSLAARGA